MWYSRWKCSSYRHSASCSCSCCREETHPPLTLIATDQPHIGSPPRPPGTEVLRAMAAAVTTAYTLFFLFTCSWFFWLQQIKSLGFYWETKNNIIMKLQEEHAGMGRWWTWSRSRLALEQWVRCCSRAAKAAVLATRSGVWTRPSAQREQSQ